MRSRSGGDGDDDLQPLVGTEPTEAERESPDPLPPPPRSTTGPQVLGIILFVVLVMAVAYHTPGSPLHSFLRDMMQRIESLNYFWKVLLFSAMQASALLLVLPATPFNLAAGSVFGLMWGSVYCLGAIMSSASVAFGVARYLAREWAADELKRQPRFGVLESAMAVSGWNIVFLIRLAPIFPYGLCSYLFGVMRVNYWTYVTATALGSIPGTIAYTYIGTLTGSLGAIYTGGIRTQEDMKEAMIVGTLLIFTIFSVIIVALFTRRALLAALNETATLEREGDSTSRPSIDGATPAALTEDAPPSPTTLQSPAHKALVAPTPSKPSGSVLAPLQGEDEWGDFGVPCRAQPPSTPSPPSDSIGVLV